MNTKKDKNDYPQKKLNTCGSIIPIPARERKTGNEYPLIKRIILAPMTAEKSNSDSGSEQQKGGTDESISGKRVWRSRSDGPGRHP
jgi:hypothetical protein